jgi:hypothetical protein
MPKVIDVKLVGISVDGIDGQDVDITGNIFGVTFNEDPHEEEEPRDIFSFPDGPITITDGQTTPMNATTSFVLTAGTEPPRLDAFFLKFGGDLNFGSAFKTVTTEDFLVVGQEQKHRVRIVSDNLEIRLDFVLNMPSEPF